MDTGAECIKHLADDLRAGTSLVVPSATRLRRKPVERKCQEGVYSCYFCGRHIFQIPPQKKTYVSVAGLDFNVLSTTQGHYGIEFYDFSLCTRHVLQQIALFLIKAGK